MSPNLHTGGATYRRLAASAALMWLVCIGAATPASLPGEPGDPTRPSGVAHISPELDDVPVSGAPYEQAVAATDRARTDLATGEERLAAATTRAGQLEARRVELVALIDSDSEKLERTRATIAELRSLLKQLALQAYVGAGDTAAADAALTFDTDAYLEDRTPLRLREAVTSSTHADFVEQIEVADRVGARLEANRAALVENTAEREATAAEGASAEAAIETASGELRAALLRLRDTRALALVDGTDLPLVALDAYVNAERIARVRTPGCHLHWSLLAGIGRIESGQGTHGGAALRPDGTLTRPITGVALDGTNGNEEIRNPDGSYMRAQGPMQFLPSTWASVAIDGDGDDVTDIQNLYDAAASAGAYLCRNSVDLSTVAGLRRAVLSYNFSGSYVEAVLRAMRDYAEAVPALDGS